MIAEKVVIDTNTALDFLVFEDPGVQALYEAVTRGATQWLVCPPMRVELARVLGQLEAAFRPASSIGLGLA